VILILLKITPDIAHISRWRMIMGGAGLLIVFTVNVLLFTGLRVRVGSKDLLTILTSSAVSFAMNILLSFASVRSAGAEGSDDDRLGTRVQEPASPLGMILPVRGACTPHTVMHDEDMFQGETISVFCVSWP